MAYLALYRRFRPQTFDDLIGQETVVKTLVNQIKTDRIGHAYLFCGARGTGKTTAAKIFARAINCLTRSGEPCGECEVCLKLADSSNLDIVEMDAASNNKVENVREIRDKVQYPPVAGRFKVYVIDEVHMLTPEAFNALLKTLEEPPKHAVFILATTEPQKLPATILSRCMRFDFKLIPTRRIADLIAGIFDKLGKEYEPSAVYAIAAAGEGSVRDALSVADTCLSVSEGKLTYSDVIEALGTSGGEKNAELVKAIITSDTGGALTVTDTLLNLGKSVGMVVKDVLKLVRDVIVVKTCREPEKILAVPEEEISELEAISKLADSHRLLRITEIFSALENDLRYSTHPDIIFQTAVLKATLPENDYDIDALLARISRLEAALNEIKENGFIQVKAAANAQAAPQAESGNPAVSGAKHGETNGTTVSGAKLGEAYGTTVSDAKLGEAYGTTVSGAKLGEVNGALEAGNNRTSAKIDFPPREDADGGAFEYEPKPEKQPITASEPDLGSIFGDFDLNAEAPPDDFGGDFQPTKAAAETKPRETTDEHKTTSDERANASEKIKEEPVQTVMAEAGIKQPPISEKRVWGTLIRKLRGKNAMLWAICQELDARIENGALIITATAENEFKALTKPERLAELQETLKEISDYSVKIEFAGAKPEIKDEKQDEKIAEFFGVPIVD